MTGKAVNLKEWKEKYPNKCAIVRLNPDKETGIIIMQTAARAKSMLEGTKELQYGSDPNYIVI